MEGLSSPGLGSGLDITGIVNSLVSADIQPKLQSLAIREADVQAKLSALSQLKGALSKFQSGLSAISSFDSFTLMNTVLSQDDIITASATGEAKEASYEIEVSKLAKKHSLASSSFTDSSTTVGSGVITIEFGSYNEDQTTFTANPDKTSQQITIANGSDNLSDIMSVINNADAGVSATIVSDESGARLLLTSDDSGQQNALKITVTDDDGNHTDNNGLSQLIFDPVNSNANLVQTVKAQDSAVNVNGLTINHSSNTLSDNIEGLSIDLLKAQPGETLTLDVKKDTNNAKSKIQIFISQYNEVINLINNMTAYNEETGQGEIFLGDASVRSLKNQLSQVLYTPIRNASSTFSMIAEIGVTTNSNGLLEIDNDKLDDSLANYFDDVGRLFARGGYTSDNLIKLDNVGIDVPAGVYDINLTTVNLGVDLAGTIGGTSATSTDGRVLSGSGDFASLGLEVLGGSTGNRGTITIYEGLSTQFDNLLSQLLDSESSLEYRTTSLESQLDDFGSEREKLSMRADKLEDIYLNQFNAMDSQLAELQSLSTFLTQQLSNLSNIYNREE